MTSELLRLQTEMATGCAILSQRRLVEGFGHLSARIPGTDHILMTPRKALGLVQADELLTLDLDGNVVQGDARPAVEVSMHVAVYRRRPDVQAISRTHSFRTSVFAIAGEPIRAVHRFGCHLGPAVPVFPDVTLIGQRSLGEAIADLLGDRQAVLLRGNGTLITAPTLIEAVMRAVWLEESAELQLVARAAGLTPRYLPPDEVRRCAAMDMPHEPIRAWDLYAAQAAGQVP